MASVVAIAYDVDDAQRFRALADRGYEVRVVRDAAHALEAMDDSTPDVLLLDWMMQDMSAVHLLGELDSRELRGQVRTLIVTRGVEEGDIRRAFQAGVDGYVHGPVTVDELDAKIRSVLAATPDELERLRDDELSRARMLETLSEIDTSEIDTDAERPRTRAAKPEPGMLYRAPTTQRPERILMGPGPSNAHPRVLEALARPLLGHLDPDFLALLDEVSERLRAVFRTQNRLTFAVSGTGSAGMEAALCNVLEPGDTAVVCVNGVFGGRMAEVAGRAAAEVVRVDAPWGGVVDAEAVADALRSHPRAKVVAMVHAETSTGAAQPIGDVASVVSESDALFVLDTVTSLAGMPVEVDAWGVDVCYSGTQKCLSVPPGLAPITFSDRALDVVRARSTPVQSWYLDVTLLERYWGSDRVYHHTAPVSMLQALHEGLGVVLEEGLEQRWERHRELGTQLEAGLESIGFSYIPDEGNRLPMLHCVRLPEGVGDEAPLRRALLDEFGIEVGAGLGEFRGTCWRVGLMGHSCQGRNVALLLAATDSLLAQGSP